MMNPYKVLGVEQSATDEQIKAAYRKLVKKYHPDRYIDNPLADLAGEKMREINHAYDVITSKSGAGSYSTNSSGSRTNTNNRKTRTKSYGSVNYHHVRQLINSRRIDEALAALDTMNDHDAEWNYLRGTCYAWKGMYQQANYHFNTACEINPTNLEYAKAANNMHNTNKKYTQRSQNMGGGNMNACDICSCLICSDCCCECAGGDLIGCC